MTNVHRPRGQTQRTTHLHSDERLNKQKKKIQNRPIKSKYKSHSKHSIKSSSVSKCFVFFSVFVAVVVNVNNSWNCSIPFIWLCVVCVVLYSSKYPQCHAANESEYTISELYRNARARTQSYRRYISISIVSTSGRSPYGQNKKKKKISTYIFLVFIMIGGMSALSFVLHSANLLNFISCVSGKHTNTHWTKNTFSVTGGSVTVSVPNGRVGAAVTQYEYTISSSCSLHVHVCI